MKIKVCLAVLASLLLSACATQGPPKYIGVTMPDGEKATIVAHNQSVPDYMLSRDSMKLNYIVKGGVSEKQLAAVAETERACRIYTETVRPHSLVAVLSSGVIYSIAGAAGLYFGSAAFAGATHALQKEYAEYGAWASGTGGTANGLISLGGQTYTFESCGREIFTLFPGYNVRVLNKSPY